MITPSFNLTATERVLPKLALDFTTASLDPRVTFTRTTDATHPATYVNSSGVVTAATDNQPRFDYDPVSLTCKGLLIEESRTNLYTYSEDFRDTATAGSTRQWSYSGSTVVVDQTTAPDGNNTADLLLPTAGLASHRLGCTVTMSGSVTYTQTLYAKPAGYSRIALYWTGVGSYTSFDVSTGQILTTVGGIASTISNAGNGWYKITNTYTQAATPGGSIRIYVVGPTDTTIANFDADGTSGIYIWGAQLEAGAFATSYIPTSGTSLTRNADVATMTGTNFSSWYNQSEGAFAVNYLPYVAGGSTIIQYVFDASLSGRASFLSLYKRANADTSTRFNIAKSGSADVAFISMGTFTATANKAVCSYKLNDSAAALNGAAAGTDIAVEIPTVDTFAFGSTIAATGQLNGTIQKFYYYPKLTNAEVQAFSKQG